jgi:hypothetical protein
LAKQNGGHLWVTAVLLVLIRFVGRFSFLAKMWENLLEKCCFHNRYPKIWSFHGLLWGNFSRRFPTIGVLIFNLATLPRVLGGVGIKGMNAYFVLVYST